MYRMTVIIENKPLQPVWAYFPDNDRCSMHFPLLGKVGGGSGGRRNFGSNPESLSLESNTVSTATTVFCPPFLLLFTHLFS